MERVCRRPRNGWIEIFPGVLAARVGAIDHCQF